MRGAGWAVKGRGGGEARSEGADLSGGRGVGERVWVGGGGSW